MASRGRGRGRGRGYGGGYPTFAAQLPFVLYPEDVNLPGVKLDDIDVNMKRLLKWNNKFQNYWKASPYLLEDTTCKESQSMHIARFSDKKKTVFTRDSLSQVLVFNEFPKELVQGTSRKMPSRKKFRWNPESEMKTDFFEKLWKKAEGQEDKDEKEKKDGENEDEEEDENAEEEEVEEDLSDDDYNQNEYFDDDEDDYNDADDGDDEGIY